MVLIQNDFENTLVNSINSTSTSNQENFYINTELVGNNIIFFHFYQNIYYYYIEYNIAINNFKFFLLLDKNDDNINLINILKTIDNIIDFDNIKKLINNSLVLNNGTYQISLLTPNNTQIYNKLLNKNNINEHFLFQSQNIPIYISWGLASPENLYYIDKKLTSSYVINFGPCIFDELSCYIKLLNQKNNDLSINDIINNNPISDLSNVNLFILTLDNQEELNYIYKFVNIISKNIEIYKLKSINNNINIGNSVRINNDLSLNYFESEYNNYLKYIIDNKIQYNNLENTININGPNIKIITIPTAETIEEFNKTNIGLHIDKSLDILDLIYNNLSNIEKNNSQIYIKTYSKYSIETLFNNLIKNKFLKYVDKITLSSYITLDEFYNNFSSIDKCKLNNLKYINSFNFNISSIHNDLQNIYLLNSLNNTHDNTFTNLDNISNINLYNAAYLDCLWIYYLTALFKINNKNNNSSHYQNTSIAKNKLSGTDFYNMYIDKFNFNKINDNSSSIPIVYNFFTQILSSQHFQYWNTNYINKNYISNRSSFFSMFSHNCDLSLNFYWQNDVSGIFISSDPIITENLIRNIYDPNILIKNLSFFMHNVTSLNITFNENVAYEEFTQNFIDNSNNFEYYINLDNSNIDNSNININNNNNNLLSNGINKLENDNINIQINNDFIGDISFTYYIKCFNTYSNLGTINIGIISSIPTILLDGSNIIYHQIGTTFIDPGIQAYVYNLSGEKINLYVDISSNLNINALGNYTIKYSASNDNNDVSINRNVQVIDTTPPNISINGNIVLNHFRNTTYNDLSAVAYDFLDGSLNVDISNNVDNSNVGIYKVIYSCIDSCGNDASAVRIVSVIDWIDYSIDASYNDISKNLSFKVDNYGSKNGTGFDGFDSMRILEVTTNFLESQSLQDGPGIGNNFSSFSFNSETYYYIRPVDLGNANILADISINNSIYSIDNTGYLIANGYIFTGPPLKSNDSYTLTINLNNFQINKTYALLFDDGTFLSYYKGDTIEIVDTYDIPTNNIFVWSM
tara:strand:+ start:20883 stop:23975 length:3093 start_codon:yes stop_codon:yes gene_type:complete